jgi:predicted RNA binding protein YcfA (HicA-like mRNA interferase family)
VSRRFPVCTAKGVVRVSRHDGFALVTQKGSHQKWRHTNGRQVIVPMHGNKPIPMGTLKSIVEGAGLIADDFRRTDIDKGDDRAV